MKKCLHCYVSGHVQGVAYRASTQAQADELDIRGYARNLPDGRVEVLACGEETAVQELAEWLWKGPGFSRVSDVACTWGEVQDFEGFQIR